MPSILDNKFEINSQTGCWEWVKAINDQGYGISWYGGKTISAHRLSYILHKGSIPEKRFIIHSCDNKKCINPDHLSIGTPAENSSDMVSKKRQAFGERVGTAKLTEEQVKEIRISNLSSRKLSKLYNISKTNILDIKRNYIWRLYADK